MNEGHDAEHCAHTHTRQGWPQAKHGAARQFNHLTPATFLSSNITNAPLGHEKKSGHEKRKLSTKAKKRSSTSQQVANYYMAHGKSGATALSREMRKRRKQVNQ